MSKRSAQSPIRWRMLGILIILISLFLGFYLKILFIKENHETRERLDRPASLEIQREAERLNQAVGNTP